MDNRYFFLSISCSKSVTQYLIKCNLYTTAFFEGVVAVMDPRESWTAKWLRVDNYLPGTYAISVTGQFDKDMEDELENRGCRWRCRPAGST